MMLEKTIMDADKRLNQIRESERTLTILEAELTTENAKDKPDLKQIGFITTQMGKVLRNLERLRKVDKRLQSEKLKEKESRNTWRDRQDRYAAMTEREKVVDFVRSLFRICADDPDAPENAERFQEMVRKEQTRQEAAQAEQERLDGLPPDLRHAEHQGKGPCDCQGLA